MMNGLDGPVVTFTEKSSGRPETSSAGPALAFFSATDAGFTDEPLVIAWTGTDAEHQLNIGSSDFRGFPPNDTKTTLPADGPVAATSDAGPRLAFKTGFDGSLMVLGWTGLSGSAERQREVDNYLNIAFTGDFQIFGDKATFDRLSNGGTAVVDATRAADALLLRYLRA